MHYAPLSDVPGCPEHYDEALICALNTLPDPNNFLSAYSYLPLDDGVRFRQPKMPKCRFSRASTTPFKTNFPLASLTTSWSTTRTVALTLPFAMKKTDPRIFLPAIGWLDKAYGMAACW